MIGDHNECNTHLMEAFVACIRMARKHLVIARVAALEPDHFVTAGIPNSAQHQALSRPTLNNSHELALIPVKVWIFCEVPLPHLRVDRTGTADRTRAGTRSQ